MKLTSQIMHAAPADQPTSVHQLAARLFPAYVVDGGTAHLAGCRLEDRLFARVQLAGEDRMIELLFDARGHEVGRHQMDKLGMRRLADLEKPPGEFEADMQRLAELGARLAGERLALATPAELVQATAVWCKFAQGKLRFTIGQATADLAFSGWARSLEAPPFRCPVSGVATFHLAATDDGRICAAGQIGVCQQTGRRVPRCELVTCSVTGRRVGADLITTCPVTGHRLLASEVAVCLACGQRVSPASIERDRCLACRSLAAAGDDPRLARLLDAHPALRRWRKWTVSETATVCIFVGKSWLRRVLLVVEKAGMRLSRVAVAGRLSRRWTVLKPDQAGPSPGG